VWRINLARCFLALLTFIELRAFSPSRSMLLPLGVVKLGALLAGVRFSLQAANAHRQEFDHVLSHGEVRLIAATPVSAPAGFDRRLPSLYLQAVTGGVCWAAA